MSDTLLGWLNISEVGQSAIQPKSDIKCPEAAQEPINLNALSDYERFQALVGIGRGLIEEGLTYGVRITIREGKPYLCGTLPACAKEAGFLMRLRNQRRPVIIAADSFEKGWTVEHTEEGGLKINGPGKRWPRMSDWPVEVQKSM
ncbi:hypothetical protein [Acetobacter thailandicus]|uniref:hypothetical protein n=1 Tax=Acetobacter thailandicus TaxID=1502842 RepID=UPI001BABE975|nr:hypothetical protein [Acetobacter thailandicus]MBS1003526.1 hypothetical protein [Acetobacter thailandicus]